MDESERERRTTVELLAREPVPVIGLPIHVVPNNVPIMNEDVAGDILVDDDIDNELPFAYRHVSAVGPFASIKNFDASAPLFSSVQGVSKTLSLAGYKLFDWMITNKVAATAGKDVWNFPD